MTTASIHAGAAGPAEASRPDDYYLEVTATRTRNRIRVPFYEGNPEEQEVNPVSFVTGLATRRAELQHPFPAAQTPAVSFVIGQYGLGKTTLMRRIERHLETHAGPGVPRPVFVNLAQCGRLREGMDAGEFGALLFRQLPPGTSPRPGEVHSGECLLLLDGLDELATDPAQHRIFIDELMALLRRDAEVAEGSPARFNAVVSMRLDFLKSITRDDASELTRLVKQGMPVREGEREFVHVHFLSLDALNDYQLRSYLADRLGEDDDSLWTSIGESPALKEMLRRPLLLRIFTELVRDHPAIRPELTKYQQPVELVHAFVERAARDRGLVSDQATLAPRFRWDVDRLAATTLRLYEQGRTEMGIDHIRSVLVDGAGREPPPDADDEEVLRGVHKCPFLLRDPGPSDVTAPQPAGARAAVRFSHKLFYEYFTARGMVPEDKKSGFIAFDRLVLNVDMRKYLRWLMERGSGHGIRSWYDRTLRSYALSPQDWHEWEAYGTDPSVPETLQKLDRVRRDLLDLMTEPERFLGEKETAEEARVEDEIRWLLDNERRLHPRYLTYNFEAVAVYVPARRRKPDGSAIAKWFSRILEDRLREIFRAGSISEPWNLLVERILDIGQRLWLPWAREFEARHGTELLAKLPDRDSQGRVERIFSHIRLSKF